MKDKLDQKIKLMTHVVIGYPSLESTISLVKTMVANGADMVELQIPFSDPLADGPTIMKACEASLAKGTRVKDAFDLMSKLSKEVKVPLLFMCYYNTVFKYGVEKFIQDAKVSGCSGLIVPDMSIEEESGEHFYSLCRKHRIDAIHVISPASTDARLRLNAKVASGFIYATAQQGTTGARSALDKELDTFLRKVRRYFTVPIAVGFGISKKEHIESIAGKADIAIVGSAIIDVINKSSQKDMLKNVGDLVKNLRL